MGWGYTRSLAAPPSRKGTGVAQADKAPSRMITERKEKTSRTAIAPHPTRTTCSYFIF